MGEEVREYGGLLHLLPHRELSRGGLKHGCACSPGADPGEAFFGAFYTEQLKTSMGRKEAGRLPGGGII